MACDVICTLHFFWEVAALDDILGSLEINGKIPTDFSESRNSTCWVIGKELKSLLSRINLQKVETEASHHHQKAKKSRWALFLCICSQGMGLKFPLLESLKRWETAPENTPQRKRTTSQ